MARIGRGWPALVLAVALGVRLWGIGWQLPAALYFDEMKYVDRAGATVRGQPPDVADYRNPTLYRHVLEVEYRLASVIRPSPDPRETAVLQLWLARVTSAVLGATACLLTALAAARLPSAAGGAWAGLVAGLILALAPLDVHLSHYAVNDAPATFVMAAALLFGVRALTRPAGVDVLLAGLLAGLAAATKYNFGVVLMLPLVAAVGPALRSWWVFSPRCPAARTAALHPHPNPLPEAAGGASQGGASPAPTPGPGPRGYRGPFGEWSGSLAVRAARYFGLALGGFAVGLTLGMPEILTSTALVAAGIAEQARLGGIRWNGQADAPVWQLYGEALVKGLGWPVLLVAAGGVVALARRDRLALLGVLSVPVVCLAIMLRQQLFFSRFALPLLPPLALLGGLGISALVASGQRHGGTVLSTIVGLGAATLMLVPAVQGTLRQDRLATTTDTRVLAQRWLEAQAGGAHVATEVYGLPISWSGNVPPRNYRLQRVAALVDPLGVRRLACDGTRYFVEASLTSERETARRTALAGDTGYDLLARSGQIVATFDPFLPGLAAPAHPDDTAIPFWHQDAYARPGPRITIVEVPDGTIPCPP